ncbi:GGDEF domain-containing protein [Curvivirga sp.]|uniref:GGDEF domain-containing protein n=1 Tax=Curvivirga sp. TaxID=2856848 RepID=UPI003B5A6A04
MEIMDSTSFFASLDEEDNKLRKQQAIQTEENSEELQHSARSARDIALQLLNSVDDKADPIDAYCKLLENAIHDAAKAEQALAEMEAEVSRLKEASITDDLTGILNRRGFRHELQRAIERAIRRNENGLLLMIDLNEFKAINDTHGHKAGDLVLCAVASHLKNNIRLVDTAARLGGDEFAVILTGTDRILGMEKAMQIDHELNALAVSWKGIPIPISASVGVEHYDSNSKIDTVLHEADLRMYALKRKSEDEPYFIDHDDPASLQPEGYPYLGRPGKL